MLNPNHSFVLYQFLENEAFKVAEHWKSAASEQMRPSVLYRPRISIDGDKWSVIYGDNLQDGVAGFGDSPEEAMRLFDAEWYKKLVLKWKGAQS